jgi:predicted ester cyclase
MCGKGPSYVRQLDEGHRGGFSDLHLSVEDISITRTTATVYWTLSGTHSDEWHDIELTGDRISFPGKSTIRFVDEQISKVHGLPNRLQIRRALGTPI